MSKEDIEATTEVEDTSVPETEEVEESNYDDDMDNMEFTEDEVLGEEESESEEETAATEESEEEEPSEEDQPDDQNVEAESVETEEEVEQEEDTTSDEQEKEEPQEEKKPDPDMAREAFKRREAERKLREAEQRREQENLNRYLDEAKDDETELAKRQLEVQSFVLNKERSSVMQDKLDVSIQRAVNDLGLKNMDEATREFVGRRLDDFEATRVRKDQNGHIQEVQGDVYQYLKDELDSINQFRSIGAREQTTKKAKQKAAVIPKPTRAPKEPKVDPMVSGFDDEDW